MSETPKNAPLINLAEFHSNEARSMLQLYQQVERLIGKKHHHPSEGGYCEDIVRSFLRNSLPSRFSVDTGFIIGETTDISIYKKKKKGSLIGASPQIDIIIHDSSEYAPIMRSGEFVVVLPDAVRGIIEVKKRLTSKNLKEGLVNIAIAKLLIHNSRLDRVGNLFSGIYAFDLDKDMRMVEPISGTFENRLRENAAVLFPTHSVPDMIVCAKHLLLLSEFSLNKRRSSKVKVYNATQNDHNVSGQLLVYKIIENIGLPESHSIFKRIQLPEMTPIKEFEIETPSGTTTS